MQITNNMSAGQSIAQISSHSPSCKWCDAPLTPVDYRDEVCVRCYGLLSGAGLSDAEIFDRSDPPADPIPAQRKPKKKE